MLYIYSDFVLLVGVVCGRIEEKNACVLQLRIVLDVSLRVRRLIY